MNGKDYSYDKCGNMVTRSSQFLTYDEQNRLISVIKTGQPTVTFGYAEDGSRLWKKTSGEITQIWIGSLYEEKNGKTLCHVIANGQLIATFEPQGYIAGIIQNNTFLAGTHNICSKTYAGLFRGGRTPISLMSMAILVGLCSGIRVRRTYKGKVYITNNTWNRLIGLMLITSVFVATTPELAMAGTPEYDPVFYYYHTDHLGSSSIMTDSDGDLVQHYGYSPYGKEQYKNNTAAFDVSNRYTGQVFDEDIELYYYGARYYDPELARFIQPDTIIPGRITDNSQVLNRYSYAMNNPLKYIDPSGHNVVNMIFGFFGAIFRAIGGFIGGIGGFVGGFIGGIGGMAAGAIGSIGSIAGAAAVNMGSLANFAGGVGAGIAGAVGQMGSALGLWNTGSFTINATANIISNSDETSNAITSDVYGQGKFASQASENDKWINFNMGIADPDDFSYDAYGKIIPNPGLAPWDFSWILPDATGVEVSGSSVNPATSRGGGVGGWSYMGFRESGENKDYSFTGKGLGLDVGAGPRSVWAWGSGGKESWKGSFKSLEFNAIIFSGSYFWGLDGNWCGITWGFSFSPIPGGAAYETTKYK